MGESRFLIKHIKLATILETKISTQIEVGESKYGIFSKYKWDISNSVTVSTMATQCNPKIQSIRRCLHTSMFCSSTVCFKHVYIFDVQLFWIPKQFTCLEMKNSINFRSSHSRFNSLLRLLGSSFAYQTKFNKFPIFPNRKVWFVSYYQQSISGIPTLCSFQFMYTVHHVQRQFTVSGMSD